MWLQCSCLNPCFAGLLVSDKIMKTLIETTTGVLILVLLDYWFLTIKPIAAVLPARRGLNPCFAGLLVSDFSWEPIVNGEFSLNPCFAGLLVSDC